MDEFSTTSNFEFKPTEDEDGLETCNITIDGKDIASWLTENEALKDRIAKLEDALDTALHGFGIVYADHPEAYDICKLHSNQIEQALQKESNNV